MTDDSHQRGTGEDRRLAAGQQVQELLNAIGRNVQQLQELIDTRDLDIDAAIHSPAGQRQIIRLINTLSGMQTINSGGGR